MKSNNQKVRYSRGNDNLKLALTLANLCNIFQAAQFIRYAMTRNGLIHLSLTDISHPSEALTQSHLRGFGMEISVIRNLADTSSQDKLSKSSVCQMTMRSLDNGFSGNLCQRTKSFCDVRFPQAFPFAQFAQEREGDLSLRMPVHEAPLFR
jgi:hypothetical protein